jgi:hypothetical protein
VILKPLLTLTVLIALLAPASADATLRMTGDAKPRHFNWARQAQTNVPLPDAQFELLSGSDPQYLPDLHEMYLPRPGQGGWTYWDEHALFLHELGHVYDFTHLNQQKRNQFRAMVRTSCGWWSTRCEVPPGEMFAEQYAACALATTKASLDAVPTVTYGWLPPAETEAALCRFIQATRPR